MENSNAEIRLQIENELLSTVGRRYRNEIFWIILLGLICVAGTAAWIIQLRDGLGVTAMRDFVSWGLYISLLFFFVGVSLVGALVSCILRMSGAKWRYPLTRIAEVVTLSAVLFAGFMPVLDMGRPERLIFLISHGRIQSPILWDVLAIATYFFGSVVYFYLPLIPDLAIMRDKLTSAPPWRQTLYKWMAIGWVGNPIQQRLLQKALRIMCVVILPVAISVHTISAWLIAFTLRPGWNSSIMGPYFVFGALLAGTAIMILIIAKLRHGYRLERYLTPAHFNNLAKILLALSAFYLYLNINKYGVPAFKMATEEKALLEDLFHGKNAFLFWFTQIVGLAIPIVMLSFKRIRHSIKWVVTVAVMVLLGALINRYVIVVPNLLHPFIPIQHAQPGYATYNPTFIEWTITASSLAGFVLLIILLFKPFPVITMWEVIEEAERSGKTNMAAEDILTLRNSPGYAISKTIYTLTAVLFLSTISLAQAVKKKGSIDLKMTANDSMHIATAIITDIVSKSPLKGVEVTFFVKRSFGLMKLGSGTTDTTGIVSAEFPVTIPGSDASRNMTIIAKVEDSDIIADTVSQAIIQSPVPFPADKPIPRAMISPRAPWWLVITFSFVVGIVWVLFANVLYLIFRIKKASHIPTIS